MGATSAGDDGVTRTLVKNAVTRAWIGVALVAIAVVWPSPVLAHTGQALEGFMSGLLHPVFGADHFLAMLSVGIVSAQMGGRRVYTVPALFVLSMIGGAAVGLTGREWPLAEEGIAISVITLGMAIAIVTRRVSSWPVMLVVILFGSLHGHAHGLELPRSADPIYYGAGFVTSTATIHLLGVAIGHVFTLRTQSEVVLRHLGSAMAGMGVMILLAKMGAPVV